MKKPINEEFKRMQKLAGIILKEDIKKNQDYFNRYTLLDPNEGKNIKVTAPFTVDKIASAIMPLVDKQGEGLNSDNLAEFKEWLKIFMFKYSSLLKSDNITVRDLFDNMYGDYIMEVNELSNDDDNSGSTFSTPEELADFLTNHKKEYLAKFPTRVEEYVYDKLNRDIYDTENKISEKDIEKYWMDPDFRFIVDHDSYDIPIVSIDWDGANNIDMSGYVFYLNNEVDSDKPTELMGRKFWINYN